MALTKLQNALASYITKYNTNYQSPELFDSLVKSYISRNITIEDWNAVAEHLRNCADTSESLYTVITKFKEYLTNSTPVAEDITYSSEKLSATNVQDAIDEVLENAPLEKGTGKGSIQLFPDVDKGVSEEGFAFPNNPNSGLSGTQEYGAIGDFATAIGGKSQARGNRSMAQGTTTIAKGSASHAEGSDTVAEGNGSHAEGYATLTKGINSHAEGKHTIAEGTLSHAEGYKTEAIGEGAHSEGASTKAIGKYSHASGLNTEANYSGQTVVGHCNDNKETTVFEVGNGWTDENGVVQRRQNALEVHLDGHVEVQTHGETPNSVVRNVDLTHIVEVAEGKSKALVITATMYRDIPTRENFSPYDWYRADGSMIETFDDFVAYVTRGEYPEYDLQCINNDLLNGNDRTELSMSGFNYIVHYSDNHTVIPAWYISENFKVGDVLLITETDVPDWWISYSDNTYTGVSFSKLETTKVDLDSKLDKATYTSNYTEVYGKRYDGSQIMLNITANPTGGTIAVRDNDGGITAKSVQGNGTDNLKFTNGNYGEFNVQTNGINSSTHLYPIYKNTYNLGSPSNTWKEAYIDTIKANSITFANDEISIDTTANNSILDIKRHGATKYRFASTAFLPNEGGAYDLGTAQYTWKDAYINSINIQCGTIKYTINHNTYNGLGIERSGIDIVNFGSTSFSTYTHIPLQTNKYDLGNETDVWKTVYTNNIATNGVSIKVENLGFKWLGTCTLNENALATEKNACYINNNTLYVQARFSITLASGTYTTVVKLPDTANEYFSGVTTGANVAGKISAQPLGNYIHYGALNSWGYATAITKTSAGIEVRGWVPSGTDYSVDLIVEIPLPEIQ